MKRPTVLELEAALRSTAVDLASSAFLLMHRYGEYAPGIVDRAPVWTALAAQAFAAFELLGVEHSTSSSMRELRPWAGAL